ncbi:MAG: hypothetical protein ACFFCV_01555 [Promethearchaeota archaeon]
MAKKGAIIFTIILISSFGFIITVPIGVLSVNLSSYGIINYSYSYPYTPDNRSAVEKLNLNVEIGDIEIKYIDPPVDYFMRIEVNVEMAGSGLAGKSYSNYFNISEGDKTSSPYDFSMRLFSNVTQSEVDSLLRDVSITVTLRKGVIFDISTAVMDGNVDLIVPFNVHISNLNVNITNGDIFFDLTNCIVEGNITGVTKNGKLVLKSYNVEYTQNSMWILSSIKNKIYITQHKLMGANVTGSIITAIDIPTILNYNDNSPEIGAKFTLYNYKYATVLLNRTMYNFEFYPEPVGINRYSIKSDDFPANNNYIFSLYLEGILFYTVYST